MHQIYKADCRHFVGYIPCKPHKQHNVHCENCEYYDKTSDTILIIKLAAIGDVIRTSPLIHKLKAEHPNSKIWWITYYPDVVPSIVDKIYPFNLESIEVLKATKFSKLINLDKDPQACGLTNQISADKKYGFHMADGMPAPINDLAMPKFMTGLFDDVNKANRKSYVEEIFEICDWQFEGEEYIMDIDESIKWDIQSEGKKIIGLNTGCGDRWTSRLWSDDNWIELIKKMQSEGFYPLLLGGKQEDAKNCFYAEQTGAAYLGNFPLKSFISLVNQCDAVVSAVTMGMHIAMGVKKTLILMNNIFNPYEFELYGRGEIVQPTKECHCFFKGTCTHGEYQCMNYITVDMIFEAIKRNTK